MHLTGLWGPGLCLVPSVSCCPEHTLEGPLRGAERPVPRDPRRLCPGPKCGSVARPASPAPQWPVTDSRAVLTLPGPPKAGVRHTGVKCFCWRTECGPADKSSFVLFRPRGSCSGEVSSSSLFLWVTERLLSGFACGVFVKKMPLALRPCFLGTVFGWKVSTLTSQTTPGES